MKDEFEVGPWVRVMGKALQAPALDIGRLRSMSRREAFEYFPKEEEAYLIAPEALVRIAPLLYHGPIRIPFDPHRLKEGPRPLTWLNELFHKVLKYETTLTLVEWEKLLKEEIKINFVRSGHFQFNRISKDYLHSLLSKHASPLRRLEIWIQAGSPPPETEKEPSPAKPDSPPPPQDQYQAQGEDTKKIKDIERLYYHREKQPQLDDQKSLDILDEIADSDEEEENYSEGPAKPDPS